MFEQTHTPRTAVLTYDEAVVRALEPSWLGSAVTASTRIADRFRDLRDRVRPAAERSREHRAWAEGRPSDYDGPRNRDDSRELETIIGHLGD